MPDPNEPTKRKAHVKRVYRRDPITDDIDEDYWADMLRIDVLPVGFRGLPSGVTNEIVAYKFNWRDGPIPDEQGTPQKPKENNNRSRKTKILELTDPESPDEDPIKLYIIEKAKIAIKGFDVGKTNQVVVHAFNNIQPAIGDPSGNPSGKREVTVIKVKSNDLDGFEMKDTKHNESKIIDWDEYKQKLLDGEEDDDVFITVDMTETFAVLYRGLEDGKTDTEVKFVLTGNKILAHGAEGIEPLFELGDPNATDANDEPCVVRCDPLQIPVNVGFNPTDFLVGSVGHGSTTAGAGSRDSGETWAELPRIPEGGIFCAAYVSGCWITIGVVNSPSNVVVFHRSRDGCKTWESISVPSVRVVSMVVGQPGIAAGMATVTEGATRRKVPTFVILGEHTEINVSTDFGESWEVVTPGGLPLDGQGDQIGAATVSFAKDAFFLCTNGKTDNEGPVEVGDFSINIIRSEDGFAWHNVGRPFSNLDYTNTVGADEHYHGNQPAGWVSYGGPKGSEQYVVTGAGGERAYSTGDGGAVDEASIRFRFATASSSNGKSWGSATMWSSSTAGNLNMAMGPNMGSKMGFSILVSACPPSYHTTLPGTSIPAYGGYVNAPVFIEVMYSATGSSFSSAGLFPLPGQSTAGGAGVAVSYATCVGAVWAKDTFVAAGMARPDSGETGGGQPRAGYSVTGRTYTMASLPSFNSETPPNVVAVGKVKTAS